MTPEERDLIIGLFQRLKSADGAPKDREAEDLINKLVAQQPSAPYLLVQTVLVQEHALNNAQARLSQLEAELTEAKQAKGEAGAKPSFLSGMLGRGPWGARSDAQATPAPQPARPAVQPSAQPYGQPTYAAGAAPSVGAGGGFLQSALATAAGVAGGALLFDGIRSLFAHNPGPFGPALGTGWGQPGGLTETNYVVNNYYGSDPSQAASSDPSQPADAADAGPDGGLQDASYQDDSAGDSASDGGLDFGGDDSDYA